MRAVRSLPRADVAIAVALATYALVEALIVDAPPGWTVLAPLVVLTLAWRRRHAVPVIAAQVALIVVPDLLVTENVESVLPLPLIILAGYTAGREAPDGRTALLGAVAVGTAIAAGLGTADTENSEAADLVALLVLVGGAASVGRMTRLRHAETRRLRRLTAERDRRARLAVAEERARVARELHDIVAHSVSLIAVQAGAAAAGEAFTHPAWQDSRTTPPIDYAAWRLAADDVARLLGAVTLVLVPVVNPDGRDFSLAAEDGVCSATACGARTGGRPRTPAARAAAST